MMHRFCLLACLLAEAGCGRGDLEIAPVSGRVTLDGQPLASATVGFEPLGAGPETGPGSVGSTDSDGRYSLTTVDGRRGAVVGKHRVIISTRRYSEGQSDAGGVNAQDIVAQERVPARYNTASELAFVVPSGGTAAAHFALTGSIGRVASRRGR